MTTATDTSEGLAVPTEVLAMTLEWIHPEWNWMKRTRVVSRKWLAAVAMVMEREMSQGQTQAGAWTPKSVEPSRLPHRLVLCSLRWMSESFLESFTKIDLSRLYEADDSDLEVVTSQIPGLLELVGPVNMTDRGALTIAQQLYRLESLEMFLCKHLSDVGLNYVAQVKSLRRFKSPFAAKLSDPGLLALGELSELEVLNLYGLSSRYNSVTGAGIAELAIRIPSLRSLNVTRCGITDDNLETIAGGATQLQELDITQSFDLTDAGLSKLTLFNKLEVLNIGGCHQISDAGVAVLGGMPTLRKVDLGGLTKLTDEGVGVLSKMKQLTHLKLFQSDRITDKGLCNGLKDLQQLQELVVGAFPKLKDQTVLTVAGLPSLTSVGFPLCTAITDSGISALGKTLTLREINLCCCSVGDTAIMALARVPLLSALQIDSTKVTDAGLKVLPTDAISLKYLSIKSCRDVTDQGVESLAALANLRKLDVTKCPHVTQRSVVFFSKLRSLTLAHSMGIDMLAPTS
jgi:F-box/leucine-rich repeat protein 14